IMATQSLSRLAGACVFISSGTLLAAVSAGQVEVTGGALFYLATSVLAIAALYLLIDLIERGRVLGADVLAVTREAYGESDLDEDLDEEQEVGVAIPATMAILGLSFAACALLLAGMPPLSGFIAKFLLLKALLQHPGSLGDGQPIGVVAWALMALLLLSGFAAIIATARAGIRTFWLPLERSVPRVRAIEMAPIIGLLLLCAVLTIEAGPVMRFIGL